VHVEKECVNSGLLVVQQYKMKKKNWDRSWNHKNEGKKVVKRMSQHRAQTNLKRKNREEVSGKTG